MHIRNKFFIYSLRSKFTLYRIKAFSKNYSRSYSAFNYSISQSKGEIISITFVLSFFISMQLVLNFSIPI